MQPLTEKNRTFLQADELDDRTTPTVAIDVSGPGDG